MKDSERRCLKCETVKDEALFRAYFKYEIKSYGNICLECIAKDGKARRIKGKAEDKISSMLARKRVRPRNYVPAASLSDQERDQNYKNFKVF